MAFVFHTMSDQYGKNSYFKVISGDVEDTMTVQNVRTGDSEKLGNMFFPKDRAGTTGALCRTSRSSSSRRPACCTTHR